MSLGGELRSDGNEKRMPNPWITARSNNDDHIDMSKLDENEI